MVRLFILIIIAVIVLSLATFLFKSISLAKKMLLVGGSLAAAAAGLLLQTSFPFYMPLLAVVAVALLVTLVFMKVLEKEQAEKQRLQEERKARRNTVEPERATAIVLQKEDSIEQDTTQKNTMQESIIPDDTIPEKMVPQETVEEDNVKPPFGMESIDPDQEGR